MIIFNSRASFLSWQKKLSEPNFSHKKINLPTQPHQHTNTHQPQWIPLSAQHSGWMRKMDDDGNMDEWTDFKIPHFKETQWGNRNNGMSSNEHGNKALKSFKKQKQ